MVAIICHLKLFVVDLLKLLPSNNLEDIMTTVASARHVLRFRNLPPLYTREDLAEFVRRTFETNVFNVRILYSRDTGLSRRIGFVRVGSKEKLQDIVSRATVMCEDKPIYISKVQ